MAVIRIIELADGRKHRFAGQYLKAYDPDSGNDGIKVTRNRDQALNLPRSELIALYIKPSKVVPLRPDGQPNRPFTAFTIEIIP